MADTYTFAADAMTFSVDSEKRTISGLIVPFGVAPIDGRSVQFAAGDIGWSNYKSVKMNLDHDTRSSFGYGLALAEVDNGIEGTFKVADGPRGDEALALAESGVYDGLSVSLYKPEGKEKYHLSHVALTAEPAFDEARVSKIAASAAASTQEGAQAMGDTTETVEAPQDFAAVTNAITEGFASLNVPPRESVAAGAQTQVKEAPLYTFGARNPGQKDFSADIFAAFKGDGEAKARLDKFTAETFAAVASGDVNEVNPTGYRPDLYVDYIEKAAPVYAALNAGTLTDSTPFIVPKFGSASGMVADHVEGVEPTEGTFTTTGQTITPTAVSGEYSVTREVVDAGGNPQVSGLIWRQCQRLFVEAMEAKAAALLNGATLTELGDGIDLTPTAPATVGDDVEATLASAVFIDGSTAWGDVLTHRDLYLALANEKAGDGRKRFPAINPANASGTVSSKYRSIDVNGFNLVPAASLGAATVNNKSFIGDFSYAPFWATGPQQITLAPTVAKGLVVGLFGYTAGAILDANRLRKLTTSAA